MAKQFYAVAKGRVPAIYRSWSLAKPKLKSSLMSNMLELWNWMKFMLVHGDHSEENITVYGERSGEYTLREWIKKQGLSDQDSTTTTNVGDDAVMVSDTIISKDQTHTIDSVAVRPVNINDIQIINTKLRSVDAVLDTMRTMLDMQTTLQYDNIGLCPGNQPKMDAQLRSSRERDETFAKQIGDIAKKDNGRQRLMSTATEPRAQVAKLTMDLNRTTWRSFHTKDRSNNPKTVLVGSSIIQDIDQGKLSNTDVKCFSVANTGLLHEEISNLSEDKTYDRIVSVAGGYGCFNSNDTTTTVNSFRKLMESAISKAHTVTVFSISPKVIELYGTALTQ